MNKKIKKIIIWICAFIVTIAVLFFAYLYIMANMLAETLAD